MQLHVKLQKVLTPVPDDFLGHQVWISTPDLPLWVPTQRGRGSQWRLLVVLCGGRGRGGGGDGVGGGGH